MTIYWDGWCVDCRASHEDETCEEYMASVAPVEDGHVCFKDLKFKCCCGAVVHGIPDLVMREAMKDATREARNATDRARLESSEYTTLKIIKWIRAVHGLSREDLSTYMDVYCDGAKYIHKRLHHLSVDRLSALSVDDAHDELDGGVQWKRVLMKLLFKQQPRECQDGQRLPPVPRPRRPRLPRAAAMVLLCSRVQRNRALLVDTSGCCPELLGAG